jgi:hypothetical protein
MNTQRTVARHIPIALQPPATRLNNTASSSFVVQELRMNIGSCPYEEHKRFDNPTPTPIEEYKN